MVARRESTVLVGTNAPKRGRPANDPVNALGRMMQRRRLRPADVAALSGISGRKLYNILNNRTYPTEMDLFSLARALECTPDDIRDRT